MLFSAHFLLLPGVFSAHTVLIWPALHFGSEHVAETEGESVYYRVYIAAHLRPQKAEKMTHEAETEKLRKLIKLLLRYLLAHGIPGNVFADKIIRAVKEILLEAVARNRIIDMHDRGLFLLAVLKHELCRCRPVLIRHINRHERAHFRLHPHVEQVIYILKMIIKGVRAYGAALYKCGNGDFIKGHFRNHFIEGADYRLTGKVCHKISPPILI